MVASSGCCFWVEDVQVFLQDSQGNRTKLCGIEKVEGQDVFRCDLPDLPDAPLELYISFRCFYADEAVFSQPVMAFENGAMLKKTGVLLSFEEGNDMYCNVLAGDQRVTYKMGDESNRWMLTQSSGG